MITTIESVKYILGLGQSNTINDDRLTYLLVQADQAVKRYCKREFEANVRTEYRTGSGTPDLILRERPVLCYNFPNCTLVQNSTTITGLPTSGNPSAYNLLVGMPVLIGNTSNVITQQAIPNATTLVSINAAAGTAVMSAAATANYTGNLVYGLSLWFDPLGLSGDGINPSTSNVPYQQPTQLYLGLHYALQRDLANGTSQSARLTMLGSMFGLGMAFAGYPGGIGWGNNGGQNTLTAAQRAYWPSVPPMALKIVYGAGYTQDGNGVPGTMPEDLQMAVAGWAAWAYRNGPNALRQTSSQSVKDFSFSTAALDKDPDLGSVRQILSRYRNLYAGNN